MSDIEDIRKAARLMRERAQAATPGPWVADGSEIYSQFQGGPWVGETCDPDDPARTDANAAHMASWHPAVAPAVAGWLYCVAIDDEWEPETAPRIRERTAALAVARAYLDGAR